MPNPTRSEIESAIRADCATYGVNPEIALRQCQTESSFDPKAYNSRSDCYGLFQLSKIASREVDVDRYDWRQNIRGGIKYLSRMLNRFGGDYAKALAAYNWGPTILAHTIKDWGPAWREHLPLETKNYLNKILPASRRYRKKSLEVDAIRYTGNNVEDILRFGAIVEPTAHWGGACNEPGCAKNWDLYVVTREGKSLMHPGDWLIRGTKGEYYPVGREIFEETYEPAA